MIVNRRTFVAKRGQYQAAVGMLKEAKEIASNPDSMRIYVPEIAPFDIIAVELEFEDWEQYHKFWAEWSPGEAFWEKWYALTNNGGTNEVWNLVD
jgi:hypothetical protein